MKFPFKLALHRSFFVLLISLTLAVVCGLWRANWLYLPAAPQHLSLLQRLHVPQPSDPWEIDAIFNGYRVKLALPQELEKIDALPPQIQSVVRQRIEFRRRNIEVLREVSMVLDRKLENSRAIHFAAHDQTLARVVMSLPPRYKNQPRITDCAA